MSVPLGVSSSLGIGHDPTVTSIALFHSVYGLRPAVLAAAVRLRAAGHTVVTPDLYAGRVAASIEEGFELAEQTGWETIVGRAREAMSALPSDAVLAGLSMGAGVVGSLLPERPDSAGLLLLHGTGADPGTLRAGLPVELHIADPDPMFPPAEVAAWCQAMTNAGARMQLHKYPGAGHFFTDPHVAEYDARASNLAWERSFTFLGSL
jgi:dienelactone hydrolase